MRSRSRRAGARSLRARTAWAEVIGCDEARTRLQDLIDGLKRPQYGSPRRIALVGPPGCGKTMLCRAVASESCLAFFSSSGSQFVDFFVGGGARRMQGFFEEGITAQPSILFIDDFDSVGKLRSKSQPEGDERQQTLCKLLEMLDGFERDHSRVGLIVASNRPDLLDPAVMRPGRMDLVVEVPLPGLEERARLLARLLGKELDPGIDQRELARSSDGMSYAALTRWIEIAAGRVRSGRICADDLAMTLADLRANRAL